MESSSTRQALAPRELEPSEVHGADEAAAYDRLVQRHGWLLNRPFVHLLARLPLERGRVLDVGTGPGWIPIALARRRAGLEIWALDASHDALQQARAHAAADLDDRLRWLCGSATALPFADASFDLVVSHFMLHHLADPVAFLDEVARVVRPGGHVVIKDIRRQPRWRAWVQLAFSRLVLGYSDIEMALYRESLSAALTLDEVRAALARSALACGTVRGFRGLDYVIEVRPPRVP